MTKEIVKYHNDLNKLVLRNWTKTEQDLFFTIIERARDQGTSVIELTRDDFEDIINQSGRNINRLMRTIKEFHDKVFSLYWLQKKETQTKKGKKIELSHISFFRDFNLYLELLEDEPMNIRGTVEVSKDFEYLVNQLVNNFTQWELKEFYSIRSIYSKNIYRLLKQFKSTGQRIFTVEEFRELLAIPTSYRNNDITRRILDPAKKDLKPYFNNLSIKTKKQGNKITHFIFTFDREIISLKVKDYSNSITLSETEQEQLLNLASEQVKGKGITSEEYLRQQIAYTELQEDVRNPFNYLVSAIEKDYAKAIQIKGQTNLLKPNKFNNFKGQSEDYNKKELDEIAKNIRKNRRR